MHSTTWWIFLDWYEQCRILPAGNGLAQKWLAKALKTQIKHCRHGAPLRAYLPDYLPLANAHNSWSIHKIAFSHQAIFPLSCYAPPPIPILWHLPPPWDRPQCGGGSHSGGIGEPVQLLWVHFLFWTKWLKYLRSRPPPVPFPFCQAAQLALSDLRTSVKSQSFFLFFKLTGQC